MRPPTPAPLLSRLVASAIAALLLVALCTSPSPRLSVYASELHVAPEHGEHSLPLDGHIPGITHQDGEERMDERGYTADFAYFEPSLIGRAPDGAPLTLQKGQKEDMEANPGTTFYFVWEGTKKQGKREEQDTEHGEDDAESEEHEKRQSKPRIYISVNTCRQPSPDTNLVTESPPQLTLYLSTSAKNQKPGPGATKDLVTEPIKFVGGAANFSVQTDSAVYVGVSSPNLTQGWKGSFKYEVAADTDMFYHSYIGNQTFLSMIDTDSASALFITNNITGNGNESGQAAIDKWLGAEIPFNMYAFPKASMGATGLEHSLCGIKEAFSAVNEDTGVITVDRNMTDRYDPKGFKVPRGQFHVQGLQKNTNYTGFLTMDGDAKTDGLLLPPGLQIGAGGRVWSQFEWKTKADESCQVIFGLSFCTDIAYAVPSSHRFRTNTTSLAELYDTQAQSYYRNFSNSLAQVACDTTGTSQYSLARTCADCARDYKSWMCSVLMPRCEDFDATEPWLQQRNVNAKFENGSAPLGITENSERYAVSKSRNPMVDQVIKPGPYKELLPCEDLCFDIVRSCPAVLGFACPAEPARNAQYGKRDPDSKELMCNYPGAVVDLNTRANGAGRGRGPPLGWGLWAGVLGSGGCAFLFS